MRRIGPMALVAIALLATAAPASATTITSPAGTAYTGTIKAEAEEHAFTESATEAITCSESQLEWKVESHGPLVGAIGPVTNFTLKQCPNLTVTFLKTGTIAIYTSGAEPNGEATLTWDDAEITTVKASALGSIHCLYKVEISKSEEETGVFFDIGTLTGSSKTGNTATIHLRTNHIPGYPTSPLCPSSVGITGPYVITSPDYLDVD